MKFNWRLIIISILFTQCAENSLNYTAILGVSTLPDEKPIPFKEELVPDGKLVHQGILTPRLDEYYFVISDTSFNKFDIYFIERKERLWSQPEKAFFNSEYNDHGVCFSPDGNTIFFSSTRPVDGKELPPTWHLWQVKRINGKWTEPEYVDIPNLRDKLISHPTISGDGTLFFHASNLDYSEMDIYYSEYRDENYGLAKKVFQSADPKHGRCTPFVAPNASYLVYASINEQLNLMVSFRNVETGQWEKAQPFPEEINTNGQGNPFVTPDDRFLFYATEGSHSTWSIKWVNVERFLTAEDSDRDPRKM